MVRPGEVLPSSCWLAETLSISPTTTTLALRRLSDVGLLAARERSGYVTSGCRSRAATNGLMAGSVGGKAGSAFGSALRTAAANLVNSEPGVHLYRLTARECKFEVEPDSGLSAAITRFLNGGCRRAPRRGSPGQFQTLANDTLDCRRMNPCIQPLSRKRSERRLSGEQSGPPSVSSGSAATCRVEAVARSGPHDVCRRSDGVVLPPPHGHRQSQQYPGTGRSWRGLTRARTTAMCPRP